MDLRTLEYFVAVAEELSFTRASERCRISQPSISAAVRALEHELGEPLFDRLPRGIRLAPGGETLLPHARRCLEAAGAATAEFSERAGMLRGELRLGTVGGVERTRVPRLLGEYHAAYPGVDVLLREDTSAPLLEAVLRGALDAAVIARPTAGLPATIHASTLLEDRLVVVGDVPGCPPDAAEVPIAALRDQRLISYAPSSGLRPVLAEAFAAADLPVPGASATNAVRRQVALVRHGVGVALTAGSDPALADAGDLPVRPLAPAVTYRKVLVWRRESAPRPSLRAFLRLWREADGG
jgi:DNA-binding transcriptional LysR family regulator